MLRVGGAVYRQIRKMVRKGGKTRGGGRRQAKEIFLMMFFCPVVAAEGASQFWRAALTSAKQVGRRRGKFQFKRRYVNHVIRYWRQRQLESAEKRVERALLHLKSTQQLAEVEQAAH